VIINSSF